MQFPQRRTPSKTGTPGRDTKSRLVCGSGREKPGAGERPVSDVFAFFRSWLNDPKRVSSVVPSSPRLAEMITSQVDPRMGPVIELGPGTGVFTRALVNRGVAPADLTLIELGEEFLPMLRKRYPEATILSEDAARLERLAPGNRRLHGAAVSGLPLLAMPPATVLRILSGTFRLLAPGGQFFQFTYGWRCPVPAPMLQRLGLEAHRVGVTLENIPPATVYRISRMPLH